MARKEYYHYIADGGLFYDDLGNVGQTGYWKQLKYDAMNRFDAVSNPDRKGVDGFDRVGTSLIWQGHNELKREVKVLSQIFGIPLDDQEILAEDDFSSLIKAFNEALNIKELYNYTLLTVNNGTSDTPNTFKTSAAKLLGSYLSTITNQSPYKEDINNLLTQYSTDMLDGDQLSENLFNILDDAFDEAFERIGNIIDDDDRPFAELYDAIQRVNNFRSKYHKKFFAAYGFDNLEERVKNYRKELLKKDIQNDMEVDLDHIIKSSLKSAPMAGLIQEELIPAMTEALSSIHVNSGIFSATTRSAGTVGGKANTDIVHFVGDEADFGRVDLELKAAFAEQTGAGTKEDVRKAFQSFTNRISDTIDSGTIIYESTKEYNLGTDYFQKKGFTGTTYNREGLISLLKELNYYRADHFVNAYMNTAPGAILKSWEKGEKILEANIAKAMGSLLFDDYSINNWASKNGIHVFRLSNIVVPLSYLLIRAGQAYKEAAGYTDWVDIHAKYPDRVYPRSFYEGSRSLVDTSYEASLKRWNEQLKENNKSFSVQISFLKNFVSLLQGELFQIIEE